MIADELDSLPDSALNELFAVEVAGFAWVSDHSMRKCWLLAPHSLKHPMFAAMTRSLDFDVRDRGSLIDWCTDANAVLPWLEKYQNALPCWIAGSWQTTISKEVGEGETFDVVALGDAEAPTFARAAVLALIRAKRASK